MCGLLLQQVTILPPGTPFLPQIWIRTSQKFWQSSNTYATNGEGYCSFRLLYFRTRDKAAGQMTLADNIPTPMANKPFHTLAMLSEEFSASDEELQLFSRLLETNNWHKADTLSFDAAIDILKQSLTLKQLRDIWTIADKERSGNLSKLQLAMVIRLMGWVQAGQPLHERLLASGIIFN